jgi:carboxymethylenebutenolidase
MGDRHTLTAGDGHRFQVYRATPQGEPRGTVVVLQEVFGVNSHIRDVADRLAGAGYLALAPAFFDRVERDFETGYAPDDMQRAVAAMKKMSFDDAIADLTATVQSSLVQGKVGVVGFCWGGSLAWLAATRIAGLACAVSYYGRLAPDYRHEQPRCPVLFHFGDRDQSIQLSAVESMRSAQPDQTYHVYPADHGFNCDQRGSHDADSAALAMQRTLTFFEKHLG